MDPGRREMMSGKRSPPRHSITSPRHDPNNRISKSSRPTNGKSSSSGKRYLTEEEQSRQFVADEDKFVLKQSKKKADIRVREGRAKAIDYLAFSLRHIDKHRDTFDDQNGDESIVVPTPEATIQDLNLNDLRQLESDIESYLVLETDRHNRQYWKALKRICKDQRAKFDPRGADRRVLSSVAEDIDKILAPKSSEELDKLESQVKAKLRSDANLDTDYWDQLLDRLDIWKAKAVLARVTTVMEQKRRQQQSQTSAQPAQSSTPTAGSSAAATAVPSPGEDASQATKALYDREAARGVAENEEVFAAEEEVASTAKPEWSGTYQARKPRYFNRVQMGYEWNKYNQTHYDHDNPPPKVVQGYKFNIFYPDLVDKTKAPTYKIIREHGRRRGESFAAAGEEDTCLIRFIAGPPYEDIAFRIVDREWDYSAKRDRGFKSSFDKGILQLHFQFKKIFYRK